MLDTGPLAVPAVFAPHNPIWAAEGSKRILFDTVHLPVPPKMTILTDVEDRQENLVLARPELPRTARL